MTDLPTMPPPVSEEPEQAGGPGETPKRPHWVTAIGVISIIFAAIGLICVPVSTVISRYLPMVQRMMGELPDWYLTFQLVLAALDVLASIVLLVAAIALLRRRPAGAALHLVAATIYILMCAVTATVTAAFIDLGGAVATTLIVFYTLIVGSPIGTGLPYPIFLLIWFLRARIRRQIRAW